jgi:hypothetical protein
MWPSLVGHCVRDAGVARSNRAIPTIYLLAAFANAGSIVNSSTFWADKRVNEHVCHREATCHALTGRGRHLENGQIHRNNHASHDPSQENHHKGFQKRCHGFDGGIHFIVIKVGNF